MSARKEHVIYGLSDADATTLQSDDEDFYGLESDSCDEEGRGTATNDISDNEEVDESGILDTDELHSRVSRICETQTDSAHEPSTSAAGLVCPDNDPIYSAPSRKISARCSCSDNCLAQFTPSEVFSFHLSLCEMSKVEKDMLVLRKLHVLSRATDSTDHVRLGKRVTCNYFFDHRPVCKASFLLLHDMGAKQLKNLQKHLRECGPVPREHGLTGRAPATKYPYETVMDAVSFIRHHAIVFGIPQPAARSGRANSPPIYLPASQSYKIVHSKYVDACLAKDPHMRFLQYKSFVGVWKQCLPDIVFMTPRFDVCATSEEFRVQLKNVVTEDGKARLAQEFSSHVKLAQEEREFYISSMKKSEDQLAELGSRTSPDYTHYTFDFAEQVFVPHHARQVGPLYFKVYRKIQLFGVCCDGNRKQVNYLIDEDNSIGYNGAKTHGPNSVISMLDHYFTKHGLQEKDCHLHCDNCIGQNKNNFVVGYLVWRVITGKHKNITLSFMRVGHTRCLVYGHFGLIKKIYRQCDTDTLTQMAEVVQRSSTNNAPQLFDWQWREWDSFFPIYFKRIPLITKYRHFRMSSSKSGSVFVRKSWNSEEPVVIILKQGETIAKVKGARLPRTLLPAGITEERKKY